MSLPVQFNVRRPLSLSLSPLVSSPVWKCILGILACLEFSAGWWFGGGHDLHVLSEDGLKGFVSVDHGTKHQWLGETDALRQYYLHLRYFFTV